MYGRHSTKYMECRCLTYLISELHLNTPSANAETADRARRRRDASHRVVLVCA